MSNVVIRAHNLGKRYRIGTYQPVHTELQKKLVNVFAKPYNTFSSIVRRSSPQGNARPTSNNEYIWALKNISFEIKEGEVIGIIGLNGAGKSTLLKILTRITEPTAGYAETYGRVSSLLEVGTGFHPELTGRENAYMNGAILGMKKKEIDRKFDDIIAFAEVEKFVDTPVKRYSSGMRVRLAFSVAAHLEPEIMLVDEVLAVGDVGFQKKCLGKMEESAVGGRTILFVSHNMGAISTLCPKTIFLNNGRVEFIGPTQEAISTYLAQFGSESGPLIEWSFEKAPGKEIGKIKSVRITDQQNIEKPYFSTTEPISVTIEYWVLQSDTPVNVSFRLFDEQNNWICGVGNYTETKINPVKKSGTYRSKCVIPGKFLNSGRHTLTIDFVANLTETEATVNHCVAFETVDNDRIHSMGSKWGGIIKPDFEWQSKRIDDV